MKNKQGWQSYRWLFAIFVTRENWDAILRCYVDRVEMVTAQRTWPRPVVDAPRSVQLKSAARSSVSAAPRNITFYIFFTIIVGELSIYVRCTAMVSDHVSLIRIEDRGLQRVTQTVKGIFVWSFIFSEFGASEIGYFGYNKPSFDW